MNEALKLKIRNLLGLYNLKDIVEIDDQEIAVNISFNLISFTIEHILDNDNLAGEVTYEIGTDFSEDTSLISVKYSIVENVLFIEEEDIDTSELDWYSIEENILSTINKSKSKLIN